MGPYHAGRDGSCSLTFNIDASIAEAMRECLNNFCKQHGMVLKQNTAEQAAVKTPAAEPAAAKPNMETDPTQYTTASEGIAAEVVKPAVPQATLEPTQLQPVMETIPPAAATPAAAKPIPKTDSTQLQAVMEAMAALMEAATATAGDATRLFTWKVPMLARQLNWVDDRRRIRPGQNRIFKVSLPLCHQILFSLDCAAVAYKKLDKLSHI